MERTPELPPHPLLIPEGTVVGSWRLEAWAGRGVYGVVYRAVPVNAEHASPVALKLALYPRDPRFAREVELLSRGPHPNTPRLLDHGEWRPPGGMPHPFIVLEWVDGVPLYEKAPHHAPPPQQAMLWLAQLARALESLHARGGIHRDVKGGNILVRRADNGAVLTDLGSGIYLGAATLTPPNMYPGTPAYRSPESWLFELQFFRDTSARYSAGPADDLYALGVTACRLMTGEYPKLAVPTQDENGTWHMGAVLPPPVLHYMEPRLRDLILRMLSVRPEERGTAAQLADELEQAARHISLERAVVQVPPSKQLPPASGSAEPISSRSRTRSSRGSRSMAAAGLALAIWGWWAAPSQPGEEPPVTEAEPARSDPPDADTAGLGEAVAASFMEPSSDLCSMEVLAEDTPPEPQPGQARPDAKGRCPHKRQVVLNDGCWVKTSFTPKECEENGGYLFKKTCYLPVISPRRSPTSSPPDKP